MSTLSLPLLPGDFSADSRIWIYQGNRAFTAAEAAQTTALLQSFAQSWKSHGTPVKAFGGLFFNQFIILMADETASGVSGCSTDSSVHVIKQIEQQTNIRLFDRLDLAFYLDGKVALIPLAHLPQALESGRINTGTIYFNNTVASKQELEAKWLIQLKDSWLSSRYLQASVRP
jgi:hypothetical protein